MSALIATNRLVGNHSRIDQLLHHGSAHPKTVRLLHQGYITASEVHDSSSIATIIMPASSFSYSETLQDHGLRV